MNKYLASEFIASRSSSTAWLTLTALPLLFLTFTLARVVTEDPDATGILMWQSMYATGIAAPLTAMFAASAELRERHARMGGRHWRGLSMRSLRLARFVAVIACVAVFHVLNFGGTWLLAVLDGRTGANRILLLGVLSWIGAIGVAGLAMACARNTNIVITLVVFLVWQLAGTTRTIVEGPVWWAFPFAWPVRLLLPVLQVHQNAVPLEPDATLRHESPWLALLLCLVLAVAGAIIAVVTPRYRIAFRRTHQHVSTAVLREASTRRPADRPRNVLPALLPVALTPAVHSCIVLCTILMLCVAMIYPPSYVHSLFTFAILPIGAGILPVLIWSTTAPAWNIMRIENPHCTPTLLSIHALCVSAMSAIAALAGLISGSPLSTELTRLTLAIPVGSMLTMIALLIVTRFSTATTIIWAVIWTIISATLGGDVLANTPLWLLAAAAWPEIAHGPRWLVAFSIAAIACATLYPLCARTLRTHRSE